ncbi:hypothetical protein ACFL08_02205 [Patescibacteria group bacterium]
MKIDVVDDLLGRNYRRDLILAQRAYLTDDKNVDVEFIFPEYQKAKKD